MVSCADSRLVRSIGLLRNRGMRRRYANEIVGFNARMTDVHAGIGRAQLAELPARTRQRQQNTKCFDENLPGVVTPRVSDGAVRVYHRYTMGISGDGDGFARALADEYGVGTGVYYPLPGHRIPSFGLTLDLPESESASREALCLPVHAALSADDPAVILSAISAVVLADT